MPDDIEETESGIIVSSGVVSSGVVLDGASMTILPFGTAESATVNSGGFVAVNGGVMNSTLVNSGGSAVVSAGGTANDTVMSGGSMDVRDGATASGTVLSGGYIIHSGGGSPEIITFYSAAVTIFSGGTASNTLVREGELTISSGGSANVTLLYNGRIAVQDSGRVDSAGVFGGVFAVESGGTLDIASINAGGRLAVSGGGTATEISENGGFVSIENGAAVAFKEHTFSGLTLADLATIHSGTTADTVTVASGGGLFIYDGGKADGLTVQSGGIVIVSGGGKLTGQLTFETGATVSATSGGILDFDLTQTKPGNDALVNDLSLVLGAPTCTLTVDGSRYSGQYTLAEGAGNFAGTITVKDTAGETLGVLTVGATGVEIGDCAYSLKLAENSLVLTLEHTGLVNGPDDGWNDWLSKKVKKDVVWNDYMADFVQNTPSAPGDEILLDTPFTVDFEMKRNFAGRIDGVSDVADFAKIELGTGASLKFTVDATVAGTFYVYQIVNGKQKELQKTTVKADNAAKSTSKYLHLTAGEYYVAMTPKISGKGDVTGFYNVTLAEDSRFYTDADDGWNDTVYDSTKTVLNTAIEANPIVLKRGVTDILLDNNVANGNWVGFSDTIDYAKIELEASANLTFSLDSTDNAKFTLWKLKTTVKKGVATYSLTKVASVTVKADKTSSLTKLIEANDGNTYYISMESTNAKSGGNAYYTTNIEDSTFYDSADDGWNNWLYEKKTWNPKREDFVLNEIAGETTAIQFDTNGMSVEDYDNFVGHNDAADYARFVLTEDGTLNFTLTVTGDATFTVYQITQDKKGADKLVTLLKHTVKMDPNAAEAEMTTSDLELAAGEYYVSMTAKDTKKGSVFYNVTANAILSEDEQDTLNSGPLAASPLSDGALPGFAGSQRGVDSAWLNASLA